MEGIQTCLHGSGEKFLPKGPYTQQVSLEYTIKAIKLYVTGAHMDESDYRFLQHNKRATE